MSEDVSAQIRTGTTVILVSALVAVILNLMVVAQSILNDGLSNLQAGIASISEQEFENYNQKKPTGTEVRSAISLYSGRDIAILVQTINARAQKTDKMGETGNYYNYGSLVDAANKVNTAHTGTDDPSGTGKFYTIPASTVQTGRTEGKGSIILEYVREQSTQLIMDNSNVKGTLQTGNTQFILSSARFKSELIRNSTGTIIGICFTQYS